MLDGEDSGAENSVRKVLKQETARVTKDSIGCVGVGVAILNFKFSLPQATHLSQHL